jgi:ABC-type transport system involved in multi-copper enzyme maturation permease subunit
MMEALGQGDVMAKGMMAGGGDVRRFMILALASSAVFAVWTAMRLSFRMFDRPRSKGRVTDERSVAVRGFRRVMYLWFFDPQRRSKMIGPMTNPVMVKEMRSRRFGRSHWTARLFALCLVISLALTIFTTTGTQQWGVSELGQIVVIMQFALIVLLTPSLTGGMIASEIESRGWALLQMTPMSAVTIVVGKLLSALMSLLMVLVATVPCYLVMIRIDPNIGWIIQTSVTLGLSTAMALLVSAAISSMMRTTAAATATSYAVLIGLVAGTMLFWLGRDAPFSHSTVETMLMFNPLATALHILGSRGFESYDLVPGNWMIITAVCALSLIILTFQTWRLARPQ